ncbi:multidrug transporter [Microbacterium dauci]|uniref:Multidrug transporter n=1 Tax=Microbacterium dauci TaxID=3048008 RepID=A0ABT6ZF22_9MICO|nr:multidrug transporter [Microbacterium sp. LX3-4]MDJ1114762.1 multidrug transporter [Microbacterium sp. LX3-4]
MSEKRSRERHEELTAAPKATEDDAAPRIDVTKRGDVTRIDVRDDAAVRPGRGQEGSS